MLKKSAGSQKTPFLFSPSFWLLLALILLGGGFRFFNLNWDYQHSFHPDERNILGQTAGIQPADGYRVHFFAYGQLPVYLYRATGELVSCPAFFQQALRNDRWAIGVYWVLLAVLFLGLLTLFLRSRFVLSHYTFAAFAFSNFFLWYFFPVFPGQGISGLNLVFWGLLLGFLFYLYRLLKEEDNPALEHGVAGVFFIGFLVVKFFPIFSLWMKALDDRPAKAASFLFVAIVSLVLSWAISKLLEVDWFEMPLYGALGAIFFLGILPFFLPGAFAQVFGVLAFAVLVAGAFLIWSLMSMWGRFTAALFAFWTLFASLNHAGIQFTGYGDCMILGRFWAAAFSTATIPAIYLLVRRIYQNNGMALTASAFFAFAVVSIEQTHYCITESFITFLFVVVALASSGLLKEASWKNYLIAGTAFGLAMAAKTSSLYYLFILATAHLISLSQTNRKGWEKADKKLGNNRLPYTFLAAGLLVLIFLVFAGVGYKFQGVLIDLFPLDPGQGRTLGFFLFGVLVVLGAVFSTWGFLEFKVFRAQMPQWIKLMGAGALSALLFVLFSPWSLLDLRGFMDSQNYEWHVVSIADACYVLQFKDTLRYLFHLQNLMSVELWWPLGVTVVAGAAWVLVRFLFGLFRPVPTGGLFPVPFAKKLGFNLSLPDVLILCWFIPYFGFIGGWNTKFVRYMVPLIPAFCIFGARLVSDIAQWMKGRPFGGILHKVLLALVIGPSFFYSIAYMHVYYAPNPWIDASVWIYKHIPPGSMVMTEAWDDGLPTGVDPNQDPRMDKSGNPGMYRQEGMTVYELHGYPTDDSPIKKNYYADMLKKGDYISIASKKLWYTLTNCTPEFKQKGFTAYPVTSRYYRALWSGLLGYKMIGEFHNFPSFLGWEHPDDMAEESFSVYDHPRVYLFKKVEDVPRERILKILESDDFVHGIDRDQMRNISPKTVDQFIADRRQYLESKGLWARLEAVVPAESVKAPAKPGSSRAPPVPSAAQAKPLIPPQSSRKPAINTTQAVPAESPTPEIQVTAPPTVPKLPNAQTLQTLEDLAKNPVVEDNIADHASTPYESAGYQWRAWFSWLLGLMVLGWLALPFTARLLGPLMPGAYSLSKVLGFFVFAWVIWFPNALFTWWFKGPGLFRFTTGACWIWFLLLSALSAWAYQRDWKELRSLWAKNSKSWIHQEAAFAAAFAAFSLVKIFIPHIHDPVGEGYNGGGEAGMDFGFLASVIRGESFPPQNQWMAGLPISYSFYYGHLMMGVLAKFLGVVPAVAYNLGLITLFALIFSSAFGLAFGLSGRRISGWVAGFLCAAAGNPAGARQVLDGLRQGIGPFMDRLVNYDYWGPTRVIPNSINEFPYFSVLYGDMHAHTLAMPFGMLVLGVLLSLYLSKPAKGAGPFQDLPKLVVIGFLLGGISYLNTWEMPAWLVLLVMVLMVRGLSGVGEKGVQQGFSILLAALTVFVTLLGVVMTFWPGLDPQVLGGNTKALFLVLGTAVVVTFFAGFLQKPTVGFSKLLAWVAIGLFAVFLCMGVLWSPYFLKTFRPQQSEILWVTPNLRTNLGDFFGIFGFFATVVGLSFLVGRAKSIALWLGKDMKNKWDLDLILERTMDGLDNFVQNVKPVPSMMFLATGTLAVIWGASWTHWAGFQAKPILSLAIGFLGSGLLALALIFRKNSLLWTAFLGVALLWSGLLVIRAIPLYQEAGFTLGLGLFSVLWLLAFFHMGLAWETQSDKNLSASYILVSLFFFILATVEVFVMREYLGGDYLRNNTLFKFYIVAWELASVTAGVFLPRVWEALGLLAKAVKRESPSARVWVLFASIVLGNLLIQVLFGGWFQTMSGQLGAVANLLFLAGVFGWSYMEGWLKGFLVFFFWVPLGSFCGLLCLLAMLPSAPYGSLLYPIQHWAGSIGNTVLLPLLLSTVLNGIGMTAWEGKRDMARRLFGLNWKILLALFALTVLVYPVLATFRKCHDFLPSIRQRWTGSAESLSLNGLEYIAKANPYDAAAIRFLNQRVPDQPCLLEFVGEGYNSWGSRFSIFTGIPALMGWDGHVREWVTGRPDLAEDVGQRFQATEQIFRTTDTALAKKYLDAYGVRLVMVGTVERNGVPGRKGGYPAEGLAKFQGFLPLIYKNPQVEIYYNPPSKN